MSIKRRRRAICSDFLNSSRRSAKKRRTEEEVNNNNPVRPSNRRGREEISSTSSDDINYDCSSSKKRRREEDINMISNSLLSLKFSEDDDDDEINATPVVSFPCYVDEGILTEILSRLPVKSLLRFKSVSKHWLSSITRDRHFIHLHCTRSESRLNLLCISPLPPKPNQMPTQRIFSANLSFKTTGGKKVIIHNVKQTDDNWFYYDKVLEPVNGLVCFIHWGTAAVRIYNLSTREVTPWIKSTLLDEKNDKFWSEDNPLNIEINQIYQFGFHPVKKEHKVFCFWRLSHIADPFTGHHSDSYASWEALTVGRDTKWRRISVAPDENNLIKINEVVPPSCPGVHANGTIYWRNKLMSRDQELKVNVPTDPDVIIAFDVGSEKFRVIPIPSFILDDPREKMFDGPIGMLILGGRLTLMYQMSSCIVKLWMLDDDGVEKKLENCQGKGSSNWSSETITLPDFTRYFKFHGFATNADKILISRYSKIGSVDDKLDQLYSYDRNTKIMEEIEMDGIFLGLPLQHGRSLFTTYFESLFPVRSLNKTRFGNQN